MEVHRLYSDALTLIKDNRIKEGIRLLEEALLIDDEDIEILNMVGLCNYIYCNFKKARYYFERSSKLNKDINDISYTTVMYSREFYKIYDKYRCSLILIDNEKYNNAISLLEEIKEINNQFITPYEILYLLYKNNGEKDLAFENIKIAYTLDRSNNRIEKFYNRELSEKLREKDVEMWKMFYIYSCAIIFTFIMLILGICLLI